MQMLLSIREKKGGWEREERKNDLKISLLHGLVHHLVWHFIISKFKIGSLVSSLM